MTEHLPAFTFIDFSMMGLIIMGGVQGLSRGLSGEIIRMISLTFALGVGWYLYESVGPYVEEYTRLHPSFSSIVSFCVIFILALVVLSLVRLAIGGMMDFAFKGSIERIGGVCWGMVRMTLWVLVVVVVVVSSLWPHAYFSRLILEDSVIGRTLSTHVVPYYQAFTKDRLDGELPKFTEEKNLFEWE